MKWALLLLAVLFVTVTAGWAYRSGTTFDSPDETANYFFASNFARQGTLSVPDDFAARSTFIAPRSMVAREGTLLPASFSGMLILYGSLARGFPDALLALTPIFSGAALLAFFFLIRRIFDAKTAFISAVLLAIHPSFWYYTSRGMYHNALFFDLVLIGALCLVVAIGGMGHTPRARPHAMSAVRPKTAEYIFFFIAGICMGGALAVRTSEAAWIGALFVALVIVTYRMRLWAGWATACAGGIIALTPVFMMNTALYGHPFSFVYSPQAIDSSSVATAASGIFQKAGMLFFPFGVHPLIAWQHFWSYGVALFWWLSFPSILGFIMFSKRKLQSRKFADNPYQLVYLGMYVFVCVWLVLFYGSWTIHDNPDPTKVTIGTSYVRYWLPLYALGLPFAASFLLESGRRLLSMPSRVGRVLAVGSLSFVISYFSFLSVMQGEEGLAAVRDHTLEYRRLAQQVVSLTPSDAVIISGSKDKALFPARHVIFSAESNASRLAVRQLLEVLPIYIYVAPFEDPRAVQNEWEHNDFILTDEFQLSDREFLFRVERPVNLYEPI